MQVRLTTVAGDSKSNETIIVRAPKSNSLNNCHASSHVMYISRVSYLEIYNDCIRDLLCTLPDAEPPPFGTKPVRSSLTVSEVSW